MTRNSLLKQIYSKQKQSAVKQESNDDKSQPGKCYFFWSCMLIGALVGCIPLATVVTIHLRQQQTVASEGNCLAEECYTYFSHC
jgi:hypothetical protein